MRFSWLWIALLLVVSVPTNWALMAQDAAVDPPAEATEGSPAVAAPAESIASAQEGLAMRYQRFESTMLQVAEYLRKTDPERADLLVRAIGKSKESRLPDQFKLLVNLLQQDQLGDALDEQQHVVVLMQGLLDLLQSEDRKEDIEKEKQRIRDLIKDVNRLIDQEGDLRSDTERKESPAGLEKRQAKLADETQRLVDKIDGQDSAKAAAKAAKSKSGKPSPGKPGEQKPGDEEAGKEDDPKDEESKSTDDKPVDDAEKKDDEAKDPKNKDPKNKDQKSGDSKEGKGQESQDGQESKDGQPGKDGDKPQEDQRKEDEAKDDKPSPSESQPSESKDTPQGKPKKGKSQPGKQPPGQPMPGESPDSESEEDQSPQSEQEQKDQPSQQSKTPGREELQRAKEEMERAIEELKKKNHGKASDEQDKALNELTKAKEKLEEILRQLREEERELVLAALEARFRDMLARQLEIYNETVGLHSVPEKQRTDRHRGRSVELARKEETISLLAAKALTLLREEGSSIAFPEAVEQMRDDMLLVVSRLERFDVADLTQGIERDIIEALEELVEALQKEIEKSKDKKQNPQGEQGQQQQEQSLVNQLAELKTLRSLQHRVNRRTKVLGREVDGEQALVPEIVKQLREQARRQEKIQQATYDLSKGRNQ